MGKLIDLKRFAKYLKNIRNKYFINAQAFREGIAALEAVVNQYDAILPDEIDGRMVERARKFITKLKAASDEIPFVGE